MNDEHIPEIQALLSVLEPYVTAELDSTGTLSAFAALLTDAGDVMMMLDPMRSAEPGSSYLQAILSSQQSLMRKHQVVAVAFCCAGFFEAQGVKEGGVEIRLECIDGRAIEVTYQFRREDRPWFNRHIGFLPKSRMEHRQVRSAKPTILKQHGDAQGNNL
ncbi:hypothetical protein C7S18_19855 [Ahniella affigens]|uniref:Uncharacterized protein n=1 Tax=Ahniella affigens TaxID=2021234 RepID=A0A2P1PWS5_9GAMM|nr:hypothetical protein [Ahniella affigens]AVP99282.1 hypothetical protein C7S18_19855 [Ahniella affigens]